MLLKIILSLGLLLHVSHSTAQRIIFSGNFENKQIDSSWQIVTGNWRIGDVDELKIAPAENGFRYVLLSYSNDFTAHNIIRLSVDLPDSLKAKKIKINFSYYILANVVGTKIETEFYQKEIKDGLRGNLWVDFLYRKIGRWSVYQKTVNIPAGANTVRIEFYGLKSSGTKKSIVCFDNIVISYLK